MDSEAEGDYTNGQNDYCNLSSKEIIFNQENKTKLNNTTKLRKSSSSSENSISDDEILTKDFNEILNLDDDNNTKINTSNYFDNIDYDYKNDINYKVYESELQMNEIMTLIQKDLSEPYSIYTYRYFIHNWPQLCFLAFHQDKIVGAIVCKHGLYKNNIKRGYIAMLAVSENYRRKSIGSNLVKKAIIAMQQMGADEIVLETEVTNKYALKLYENLGFVRAKRLFKYYLNQGDALRLKFFIKG